MIVVILCALCALILIVLRTFKKADTQVETPTSKMSIYRLERKGGKSLFSGDRGKDLVRSSWGNHSGIHQHQNWLTWVNYAYSVEDLSEAFLENSFHPFHLPNSEDMVFGWLGLEALNRNFPGWEGQEDLVLKIVPFVEKLELSKDYFVDDQLQVIFNRRVFTYE